MGSQDDDGRCEFCGSGPTCGICGRDDRKRGGNAEVATASYEMSVLIRIVEDTERTARGQRCGGGIRVLHKRPGFYFYN